MYTTLVSGGIIYYMTFTIQYTCKDMCHAQYMHVHVCVHVILLLYMT